MGPGLSNSVTIPFWNFADVTLADEDTNSTSNTMPIGQSQATRCVEQQLDKEMHNVEVEVTKGVGKVVQEL